MLSWKPFPVESAPASNSNSDPGTKNGSQITREKRLCVSEHPAAGSRAEQVKAEHERRARFSPRRAKTGYKTYCCLLQRADRDVPLPGRAECPVSGVCSQEAFSALLHPLPQRHRPAPHRAAHAVTTLQPHALLGAGGSPCFRPQDGTAAVSGSRKPGEGTRYVPAAAAVSASGTDGSSLRRAPPPGTARHGRRMGPLGTAAVRDPGGAALPRGFWAAVRVWLEKPQVANRRLSGAAVQAEGPVPLGEGGEISPCFAAVGAGGGGREGRGAAELGRLWREVRAQLALPLPPPLTAWGGPGELRAVLRALLPRGRPAAAPARELAVQDVYNGTVTFLPLEENSEGKYLVKKCNIYQIQLKHIKDEEWSISVVAPFPEDWFSDGIVYPKLAWLGNELLSKLAKWSVEQKPSVFKSTLSLISVAKYSKVYQDLKEKYKEMVKVWPEVTDPEKFVYEDVAIATYLLIIWEEERKEKGLTKKQSFVDLGCGNGLLVHILNNEGHSGRGIDVRRRKIWDMYGPETHLEEASIIPGDSHLFPDTDWLIGNHSDELTPWIPVIAARSSYSCCYFVLPCCFFDFHGKYRRRQSKKTQYREYLDFVAQVGFVCGFHVEEDCLRIPSTKRVSFIGKSRTYPAAERALIDKQITQFIDSRRTCTVATCDRRVGFNHKDHCGGLCKEAGSEPPEDETQTAGTVWMPGFQPREKVEQIRNCASLPRDFVDEVVLNVANLLLNAAPQKSCSDKQGGNKNTWNQGESLSLREVAEHLNKETLKKLKSEYGGLQTLLKNNHQVFEVLNGKVHIRDWRKEKPPSKAKPEVKRRLSAEAFKTRLCWFFIHHPDGCSLPSEACPYAHGTEELRQSQIIKKKKHTQ